MNNQDYIDDQSKTYGELNLKQIIIIANQTTSNLAIEWLYSQKTEYKMHKKLFCINYLKLILLLDSPKILSKANEKEIKFLMYYRNNPSAINPKIALQLIKIIRKILDKWGLYDLSSAGGVEV